MSNEQNKRVQCTPHKVPGPLTPDVRMRNKMPNFRTWITAALLFPACCMAAEPLLENNISTNQAIAIAVRRMKQGPVWYWTNFVSRSASEADILGADNITVHENPAEWSVSFMPLRGADPDYMDAQPCNVQVIIQKDGSISFPPIESTLHGEMPEEGCRAKNARWVEQQNK